MNDSLHFVHLLISQVRSSGGAAAAAVVDSTSNHAIPRSRMSSATGKKKTVYLYNTALIIFLPFECVGFFLRLIKDLLPNICCLGNENSHSNWHNEYCSHICFRMDVKNMVCSRVFSGQTKVRDLEIVLLKRFFKLTNPYIVVLLLCHSVPL